MRTFLALLSLALLSSCATVFNGTKTKIHVYEGKQKGVSVYYNDEFVGYPPCVVYANKKKAKNGNSTIELRKEGYETRTIFLSRKVMPGYIVIDIILYVIPVFIDMATGALYKVQPNQIQADLSKSGVMLH